MSANTNTSGVSELTDEDLDAVSGGIIVVCRQQVGAQAAGGGGGGAGKVKIHDIQITKVVDSASPTF
jgi:hypothetical protein